MKNPDAAFVALNRVAGAVASATGLTVENPILMPRRVYEVARIATILLARWRYGLSFQFIADGLGYSTHHGVLGLYERYKESTATDLQEALEVATRILDGEV